MIAIEKLKTKDLWGRALSTSDLDRLFDLYRRVRTTHSFGARPSLEQVQDLVRLNEEHWQKLGFGLWVFYHGTTGELVGQAGLCRRQVQARPQIELDFALLPRFEGQGWASQMAQACLEVAFGPLGLTQVVCRNLLTNLAARRVAEKMGFGTEEEIWENNQALVLQRLRYQQWQALDLAG